jgi:group I intron endonuclease
MSYVYKITNLINGKLYIGKADDVVERWQKHLSDTRTMRGFILHNAIRKYGKENFDISVIEECESEEKALEREMFWIAEYKTNICKYGNQFGYNLTDGGEGISGNVRSPESRKKMSEASRGRPKSEFHKEQLRLAKVGAKLSPEHKANIGKAGIGRKQPESAKLKLSINHTGENNPQAVLNEQKVREIRILFVENTLSNKEISVKYGVAPRTIRDIKNGISWRHVK